MAANLSKLWQQYFNWQSVLFHELGYDPSREQARFHQSTARQRLVAGGERGGKSYSTGMESFSRITAYVELFGGGPGVYWLIGPDYEQPRKEFEYLEDAFVRGGYEIKTSTPLSKSQPWILRHDSIGIIQTKTSGDIRKIASEALHGAVLCEAAQQSYETYLKVRGRVAETRGWLILSGTFETSLGWYRDLYNEWLKEGATGESFSIPTWSNLAIFPGGREDPEIKLLERDYPEDLFMERFGAVPSPPHTLIFREFNYLKHVSSEVKYNPSLPVHICIDPGYRPGYYAVGAFQFIETPNEPTKVYMIDEVYEQEKMVEEVIDICMSRPWWGNVKDAVMDVAGAQHHAQKSHQDIWLERAKIWARMQKVAVLDGITRHRTFLRDPTTKKPRLIHAPHLTHTFKEYGSYRRRPDNEKGSVDETPIDRHNHMMKGIAYLLMYHFPVISGDHRETDHRGDFFTADRGGRIKTVEKVSVQPRRQFKIRR